MNRNVGIVAVVVVIAAGAYFGGQALGLFGGQKAMSDEEVSAFLAKRAEEIEAAGGLGYDGYSKLVSARHLEKQITIRGESTMNAADLPEDYMALREAQAANFLCNDEQARAALAGGAKYVYTWFSADNEHLGMLTIRNRPDDFCGKHGY